MLTAFRRLAGTWFARGLFILLILSFAVWGIEDVVRNFGRDTAVARVGGSRIELTEAQNAARRETQRLLRQLGPTFEANEAFRQAVARQAVEALVADRAQGEEGQRMGVATSAEAVRAYTFAIPTFQGVDGRFSPAILQQFLRQNDINEADFVRMVAGDLRRQQLVGAVRAGARGPQTLTRPLLAFALEQRAADVVELPLLSAPEIPEPTEAQLRRFHENNPERFSSPEYRDVTLALINAEALAPRVAVTDTEVEGNLDAARARLAASEKRTIEQVLVSDRAAADTIRTAWAGGADLTAIRQQAEAAGGTVVELGTVDRAGLPFPALAEAAFSVPGGGVTEPVQSPFGWHVLRVTGVEAAPQRSEAELRQEVRADLARERAADRAYEEANRLDDAFAGGASVEEAVSRLGLTAVKLRLDRQGNDENGRPVAIPGGAVVRQATLAAIFAPAPPRGGRLAEVPGGFMALEITETTPAQLRPFETVEAEVRRWWTLDQQRRAQEGRAAALLAAAQGGKDFAEAAREMGLGDPVRMGPSPRNPPERGPPPPNAIPRELLPGLFAATRVGEVTMAETSYGFAVARLAAIVPANLDAETAALTEVKNEVERTMQDDLEAQYAAALRARAGVTINDSMMEQVASR